MECIKEIDDESPIDPDIEGEPLGNDDVWSGSDIAGSKIGGTSFPHGFSYPNWSNRRKKLTREDLEKILHINTIYGVSEEYSKKVSKRDKEATYNFIKKNCSWVMNYGFKEEYGDKILYPFAQYFTNSDNFSDWTESFYSELINQLHHYKHWIEFPKEKLKGAAKYNRHWILRYVWARQIQKQYPTLERDFTNIVNFLSQLSQHSPTNPKDESNYPLYVSLYDTTRRLGGHEEGGWWYDVDDLIQSYKVNNYKDMRKVALHFLKSFSRADLNGKPLIILEKQKNSRGNKPPPTYS